MLVYVVGSHYNFVIIKASTVLHLDLTAKLLFTQYRKAYSQTKQITEMFAEKKQLENGLYGL